MAYVGRHRYLIEHLLLVSVQFALIVVAVIAVVDHRVLGSSPVGLQLPDLLEVAWLVVALSGGVLTLVGVWRQDARFEVAGLCLGAAAWGVRAYALFVVADALAPYPSLFLAIGSIGRALALRFAPPRIHA